MSVIVGDLGDVTAATPNCIENEDDKLPILDCGLVDDLIIAFKVGPIDGDGSNPNDTSNTLGYAYYVKRRDSGFAQGAHLPHTGFMRFDDADLGSMERDGTLFAVILHEMVGLKFRRLHPYDSTDRSFFARAISLESEPSGLNRLSKSSSAQQTATRWLTRNPSSNMSPFVS